MTSTRYLALAAIALGLPSCAAFKKKDPDYDTAGGDTAVADANPYGVPDSGGSGESVPYQPVNPPANASNANPTYSPAAYEDNTPGKPSAPSHSTHTPPAPSHAPAAHAASGGGSHVVVKGDTLDKIARQYGVSGAAIKQANGMKNDTVVLGKKLVIPGGSGAAAAPAAHPAAHSAPAPAAPSHGNTSGGKTHTVVKGDSLGKIAAKYGTTSAAIKKANNMKSDTVVLGSKLRIP